MGDSLNLDRFKDETLEKESQDFLKTKVTEIHPLAFTIEFHDQKFDESKKSKVQERLSALTLKHRRNPSLPDFRDIKSGKNGPSSEKVVSPLNPQQVPLNKRPEKCGKIWEIQWKSTALKTAKNSDFKPPVLFKQNLGMKDNSVTNLKGGRRYSLDGIDDNQISFQKLNINNTENTFNKKEENRKHDVEIHSDTVSEAGTYTVDKEEETGGETSRSVIHLNKEEEKGDFLNGRSKDNQNWISNWVRDVEKQNLLNPAPRELSTAILKTTENEHNSGGASKIPSPINTLVRKAKPRSMKPGQDAGKVNGSVFHKRSSSLSAKDYNENQGSESSLETESFLKATESVMTSMHNRMKFSLDRRSPDLRRLEKRNFNYKERPHPPSTASDTDSNTDTDGKTSKKFIGNPFTSARLNKAFSLRRAKAEPEGNSAKKKPLIGNVGSISAKQDVTSKVMGSKPPSSTSSPFSRLDCGRFSMRSTASSVRVNSSGSTNPASKKEVKKSSGGNRSTSWLSSREVEFQNWRRRKSFDPMKAAAEGRKKELAKKAAMNHSMTQSVTLGGGSRARSEGGNPVLRSASFHSAAQVLGSQEDGEEFLEQYSTDEQEESGSSYLYYSRSHPQSQLCIQCKSMIPLFSSRGSLVSESHSSPSRRLKSRDLENLILSAINEASCNLKLKSCKLLKKINYLDGPKEEKSWMLRNEITVLESGQESTKNSPVHKSTSRDLSAILKNLKAVENVFSVLEDVLFDENVEIYVRE